MPSCLTVFSDSCPYSRKLSLNIDTFVQLIFLKGISLVSSSNLRLFSGLYGSNENLGQ